MYKIFMVGVFTSLTAVGCTVLPYDDYPRSNGGYYSGYGGDYRHDQQRREYERDRQYRLQQQRREYERDRQYKDQQQRYRLDQQRERQIQIQNERKRQENLKRERDRQKKQQQQNERQKQYAVSPRDQGYSYQNRARQERLANR